MTALKNTVQSSRQILGRSADTIEEELEAVNNPDQKLAALEKAILKLLKETQGPGMLSRPMALDVLEAHGMIRAGKLSRKHKIHMRRMQRVFLEEIGVSAKVFARIVRFNRARRAIEKDSNADLLWLAQECGYADQSHFTRNFREMFGVTPAAFKARVKELRAQFIQQKPDVVFLQDTAKQTV